MSIQRNSKLVAMVVDDESLQSALQEREKSSGGEQPVGFTQTVFSTSARAEVTEVMEQLANNQ
jgi:hypothetical protein